MYVQKHIHWRVIWGYSWKDLLIFFVYDLTLAILHGPLGMTWLDIPWQLVSILGVAVSFYVGFKNSSSYNRFNEARQLWVASVSLGYHPDGRRNRPVAYGKTKREAMGWIYAVGL